MTNNSNINITDTIFTDLVPNNTSFVSGSVKIDLQHIQIMILM
ncbi:hypothetical protein Q5M85_05690 [Paraclostridium bifermentans]|nr:hypothetical protein [Paraclostridium bifermentans]